MVRLAKYSDLERILEIYEAARKYMRENGNPLQWQGGHPAREILEADIEKEQLYVYEQGGRVHGVFAFIIGDDKTYAYIEGGSWLNDEPYGTIHRIAASGEVRGVFGQCVDYCKAQIDNLRIDTHRDNKTMRHLVTKHGFTYCGIIFLENGDERLAYHYV